MDIRLNIRIVNRIIFIPSKIKSPRYPDSPHRIQSIRILHDFKLFGLFYRFAFIFKGNMFDDK